MKRLLYRALYASLLTATGLVFAVLAPKAARTQPPGALLDATAAIILGYAGTFVFVYACGAVWHLGRADACRYVHRRQRPDARRIVPGAAAKQQHAAAMAAVAADPMQPQGSFYDVWMQGVPTDGTPALRPLGPTPTSEEELSTWGPAGRPMGFAPTVTDAPPELRTAPTGRHAGVSDELREFDYEPAGVAR